MSVLKRSFSNLLINRCFKQYQQNAWLSTTWIEQHIHDEFVKKARYQNYRARSAFKIIQIDDEYKIFKPGQIVIECGAAPGSWTQVIVERLELGPPEPHKTGALIALDILDFSPVPGAICLPKTDFKNPLSQAKIITALNGRKANVIVSDMAPNVSGNKGFDHERIVELLLSLIKFSIVTLQQNGTLLMKIFNGSQTDILIKNLEKIFNQVRRVKPPASRTDSTEIYILASGYKGTVQQ